jgi:hypothetical protein
MTVPRRRIRAFFQVEEENSVEKGRITGKMWLDRDGMIASRVVFKNAYSVIISVFLSTFF